MDFNPVGGSVVSFPGAGFPASERTPSTFQVIDVSGSAQWRDNSRNWEALWSSPRILAWPQMQDEFATEAIPRRFPGCVCELELTNLELLDTDHLHIWKCQFQAFVSSTKHDRMQAIHRVAPEISEDLAEANLCLRFTLQPAPKLFQLQLYFTYPNQPDFNEINIRGTVHQIDAGWTP